MKAKRSLEREEPGWGGRANPSLEQFIRRCQVELRALWWPLELGGFLEDVS